MTHEAAEAVDLLTPGEVAALFRVDPKTVTRWERSGKLTALRTPGGHRRFLAAEVRALARPAGRAGGEETPGPSPAPTTR